MVKKKLLFIYNELSGKGVIKTKLAEIIDLMVKQGFQVTVHPTQFQGDAAELVENEGSRYDLVVCSGGDGTLDEVVTGMMGLNDRRPIGYIPAGSTNDFANSLQLPKNLLKAAEVAVSGQKFRCDIGRFNENSFVYVAAFGIFTEVSYETNQELKNLIGHAAYIIEGVKSLIDTTSYKMRVEYEETVLEGDYVYGMVSNSVSIGGFTQITGKDVQLNDGIFEVTLISMPRNPLELNEIVTTLFTGQGKTDLIHSFKTARVSFFTEEEVPWTLDGEFGGAHKEVIIQNCHDAVQFMISPQEAEQDVGSAALA